MSLLRNEIEIYNNGYINFKVIEIIEYNILNENDVPNYVEDIKTLTKEDIIKHHLTVNNNQIALIEDINYKLLFNNYETENYYHQIKIKDCNSNQLIVNAFGNNGSESYNIDYCQVSKIPVSITPMTPNHVCVYSVYGITNEFFDKLKISAKEITDSYLSGYYQKIGGDTAYRGYSHESVDIKDYSKKYDVTLKYLLEDVKNTKSSVDNNLQKVRKISK